MILAASAHIAGIGPSASAASAQLIFAAANASAWVVQQALWELCVGNTTAEKAAEDASRAVAQVGLGWIVDTPLMPGACRAGPH